MSHHNRLRLHAVLFLLVTIISSSAAQTWSSSGPYWKAIKAIAISPTDPNLLYAAALGWGVFKSTDGGATWKTAKTGITNTYARSVLLINDNTVYAGTNDGVYKTIDGGASWAQVLATANSVRALAVDKSTGAIYAGTYGSGLYKTLNQGSTWTAITVVDPSATQTLSHLWSIGVFGRDSLYVGGSIKDIGFGGALFSSIDGGAHWTQVQRGTGIRSSVRSIAINPTDHANKLVIGTAAKGPYRSNDGGVNWSNIDGTSTSHPMADPQINAIQYAGTNYVAGSDSLGDVYIRAISDATFGWSAATGLPGRAATIDAVLSDPSNSSVVYAATEGAGVYRSTDGGLSFSPSNSGMMNVSSRSFAVNGDGRVFLGTENGDGLWVSSNHGTTWTKIDSLSTVNGITSIDPTSDPLVLYLGTYGSGVYKSTDGGAIWHVTDTTILNNLVRPVVVDPGNPDIVYAGTRGGVYKTTNGGATWFAVNNGIPPSPSIRCLIMDPFDTNTLYAGADSTFAYKTTDAGASWSHLATGNGFLSGDFYIRSLIADETVANRVYCATDGGHLYRSDDGGAGWTIVSTLPASPRAVAIDPWNNQVLFAATSGSGIVVSADFGAHWLPMNDGLTDTRFYTIEHDRMNPVHLYAGGESKGSFATSYTFVNQAPVFQNIPDKDVRADSTLVFQVAAIDPEAASVTLGVTNPPAGSTFVDSGNGVGQFAWTPTTGQAGNYTVTFTASDGSLTGTLVVVIAVLGPDVTVVKYLAVKAGWNLLSVPLVQNDYSATAVFPHAISQAFAYNGGYIASPVLELGRGYWLKFPSNDTVVISGKEFAEDTLPVAAKWNIVGSASAALHPSFVSTIAPATIVSNFYGYSPAGGYSAADSIRPGFGYWVKISAAGSLILKTHPTIQPVQRKLEFIDPNPPRRRRGQEQE